ncbi:MAG: peptidylprolyl isomerase [Actinomycetes bacterium]
MGTNSRKRSSGHDRIAAAKAARERALQRKQRMPYFIGGIVVVVAIVAAIALLASSGGNSDNSATSTSTTPTATDSGFTYGTAPCAPATVPSPPTLDFPGTNGFVSCLDPASKYVATFDTTAGVVKVALDTSRTPGTTNNFVQLTGYGYYDTTKLFRTDASIGIIQGGAPHTNSASDPGPGYTISDEGGKYTYQPGQLVMARTSGANSAGAQFFFTVDDHAAALDGQGTYVVFGTVTEGLDVLQQILASDASGSPSPEVTVNSLTIGQASLVPGG